MDIKKEIEALRLFAEHGRIEKEVSAYRNDVMDRSNSNRSVALLLAGEFMANATALVAILDGDEEAVRLLREYADNIENSKK